MQGVLIRWGISALALWLTSEVISGIHVDGAAALFVAALVLGILNAMLRPLLLIVTLPINLLSLGLFTFVINGAILKLTAFFVGGFHVEGFWSAVIGALLISVFSLLLNIFVADSGHIEYIVVEQRRRL